MSGTTTLTIRVPIAVKHRLDKLAKTIHRTRSWLAADAVENYVADQESYAALLDQAEREVGAGLFVPHEKAARWLLSWGSDRELPPPACK